MTSRPPQHRSRARSLPLALSLAAHGCVLAALACFAPIAREPEREAQPVTVRLVPHPSPPADEFATPRASNRRSLPDEPSSAPIPIERESEAELPAESYSFASEIPAAARHSAIGVGAAGMLRVPGPRAAAPEDRPTPTLPGPAAGVLAPVEQATPPVPLDCPPPEYPAGAASVGEAGRVRLELHVDSDGRVDAVRVLRSSGFARLDEAAELGVRSWRFRPARRAGSAIAWRLEHTLVFRVDPGR